MAVSDPLICGQYSQTTTCVNISSSARLHVYTDRDAGNVNNFNSQINWHSFQFPWSYHGHPTLPWTSHVTMDIPRCHGYPTLPWLSHVTCRKSRCIVPDLHDMMSLGQYTAHDHRGSCLTCDLDYTKTRTEQNIYDYFHYTYSNKGGQLSTVCAYVCAWVYGIRLWQSQHMLICYYMLICWLNIQCQVHYGCAFQDGVDRTTWCPDSHRLDLKCSAFISEGP